MKKNIFLLIATFATIIFLHACKYGSVDGNQADFNYYSMKSVDYRTAGMHYKVFASTNGAIFVVNVTNDSLTHLKLLNP